MNTRDVLQDLMSKSYTPYTVICLREGFSKYMAQHPEHIDMKTAICAFLTESMKDLFEAINLPLLNNILVQIKKRVLATEFTVKDLKISNDPTVEEASLFCATINIEAQKIQQEKEELTHYISFFTTAKGYVSSFASAAEILLREHFEGRKELSSSKAAILNDLEAYQTFLTNSAKEITRILEDILTPRGGICIRMESSLRLIEKFRDPTSRGVGFSIT